MFVEPLWIKRKCSNGYDDNSCHSDERAAPVLLLRNSPSLQLGSIKSRSSVQAWLLLLLFWVCLGLNLKVSMTLLQTLWWTHSWPTPWFCPRGTSWTDPSSCGICSTPPLTPSTGSRSQRACWNQVNPPRWFYARKSIFVLIASKHLLSFR